MLLLLATAQPSPAQPSDFGGAVSDQATLTSFLVMTSIIMMLVAMVTISPMMDETDVSDREKESSDSDSDGKTQVVVKKNTLQFLPINIDF